MSFLVLAYPEIKTEDFEWIQKIRSQHDELYYNLVEPHFTIVFPSTGIETDRFSSHVKKSIGDISSFRFVIRSAMVSDDRFVECFHTFLVPDEGWSDITKLHDRLYVDILAPQLRLDIPFIPHVGIGNSKDARRCKELADTINRGNIEIEGRVRSLDIVNYENDIVTELERISLS